MDNPNPNPKRNPNPNQHNPNPNQHNPNPNPNPNERNPNPNPNWIRLKLIQNQQNYNSTLDELYQEIKVLKSKPSNTGPTPSNTTHGTGPSTIPTPSNTTPSNTTIDVDLKHELKNVESKLQERELMSRQVTHQYTIIIFDTKE